MRFNLTISAGMSPTIPEGFNISRVRAYQPIMAASFCYGDSRALFVESRVAYYYVLSPRKLQPTILDEGCMPDGLGICGNVTRTWSTHVSTVSFNLTISAAMFAQRQFQAPKR